MTTTGPLIGFESKASNGPANLAADMAMQAYALLAAAAHGSTRRLQGPDWRRLEGLQKAPAEAQVEKKAATAQIEAFGG